MSGTAFLVYFTRIAGISPPSAWIWAQFVAANICTSGLFIATVSLQHLTEPFRFGVRICFNSLGGPRFIQSYKPSDRLRVRHFFPYLHILHGPAELRFCPCCASHPYVPFPQSAEPHRGAKQGQVISEQDDRHTVTHHTLHPGREPSAKTTTACKCESTR